MSSTTSQKFRDFTGEPLKDKHVSEVPGLGPKLASNLEESGITKVCLLINIEILKNYLN
jgi:predicted flap endonuclease-1-like 5' DNA nuclease